MDQPAAANATTSDSSDFLRDVPAPASRDVRKQRLDAALIDAAHAIRLTRDRHPQPGADVAAMLDRCQALFERARLAAKAGARYVAVECLDQIERELVLAMDREQLAAALAVCRVEAEEKLDPWRRRAALAALDSGREAAPTLAAVQALMRAVHEARQAERYRIELARGQVRVLLALVAATVLLFSAWALVGGFEWVVNEEVEVTLAMMLANGVLFGFLGGLLSVSFGLLRMSASIRMLELRTAKVVTIARPWIGAAVAIPIAFFLRSGLLNLGNVSPEVVLFACLISGFSERWFVARLCR